MTTQEFIEAGIPISDSKHDATALKAEAGLNWLNENTTLKVDVTDIETVKALPGAAKLFIVQYVEIMSLKVGVSSQSIEGLSISFDNTSRAGLIWATANDLLAGYVKSQVKVFPAKRRW